MFFDGNFYIFCVSFVEALLLYCTRKPLGRVGLTVFGAPLHEKNNQYLFFFSGNISELEEYMVKPEGYEDN